MKTLVNKNNPQIRITAPEVEKVYDKYYYIIGIRLGLLQENWTLVEEEPVDLEKEMDMYYGMYRDKTGKTYDVKDDEPCFDWKEDELSEHQMRMARHFYELGLNARKEE